MHYLMESGNIYLISTGLADTYREDMNRITTRGDSEYIMAQFYATFSLDSDNTLEECFEESISHTK